MTVSRALRNSPGVATETRNKILAAAESLGYRPDPELARIMLQLQERRRTHNRETIAVIREGETGSDLPSPIYQYVPLEAIRQRAERFGYLVEEFWIGGSGVSAKRMNQILEARGIRGVIVSPQSVEMPVAELDYTQLAAATFGYGLQSPALHRSAGNMTLAMKLALKELHQRGYRRIGLALSQWVEARAEDTYTSTLLHYQHSLPEAQRVPPFQFPSNDLLSGKADFLTWLGQHRPDVLISFDRWVPTWIKHSGFHVPDDIGLLIHDWTPKMQGLAGINHHREHVAAAAVDLVVTQLIQNETGIPEVPRQILIPPSFEAGASLR